MKIVIIALITISFIIVKIIYSHIQNKPQDSSSNPDQLRGYETFIENLRLSGSRRVLSNGGENYAIILLKELIIEGERQEIFIYERKFPSKLFMDYKVYKALRNALALKTTVKILYNEETEYMQDFKRIMNDYPNILYKQTELPPDCHESAAGIQLIGDRTYRYEFNGETHESYFSFNQPDVNRTWQQRLLAMWKKSKK